MDKKARLFKLLAILPLIFTGFLLTLTACTSTPDEPGPELDKVTIMLDWSPNTNHTGLFVAQEKGYFAEQGLEVSITNPSSQGTLEQLVATGKVDFGVSHQEQVTTARVNKLPIVSLAAIIQHNTAGFASLKSKNIHSATDFENKKYGGWGLPSEIAILKALMKKEGGDFEKIEMINIGEADQLEILNRDIDFTLIYYGWTGIQAELRGQELNMIWLKDIGPELDFYTPVIITNEKMIAEKPELITRLMKAISNGYSFAIQNPDQAAEILIKHAPEADPEMIRKSQKWLSPKYQAEAKRWGEQKEIVWQSYAQWLYDNDLIPEMLDFSKAFTNDFLPQP